MDSTRREFIVTTALAAGGLALGCGTTDGLTFDDDAEELPDQRVVGEGMVALASPESVPAAPRLRFGLGVASGDPSPSGAILWTRYTPVTRLPLRVGVWEMDGARYVRQVVDAPVTRSSGGYVQADVPLAPDLTYRYCFLEMDGATPRSRSAIGQLNASPSTLRPVTVAAWACTKQGHDFSVVARAAARADLDLVLLLGDTTYADGATTRSEYRAKWAENLGGDPYKALRAQTPVVATWDDHDVENNWNPATIDPAQLAAARAAFLESLPIRRNAEAPGRIWRQVSYGPALDVFVLDCRSERLESQKQLVSRAQLDWLKAALAASGAVFKLIMTSVPIGEFPWLFHFVDHYRWTGYPAQRSELLTVVDGVPGAMFLAGDFHLGSVGRVSSSGAGASTRELLCGPGAQTANPLWTSLGSQFDFRTGTNNYTTLRLDPARREVRVQFRDGADAMLFDRTYPV